MSKCNHRKRISSEPEKNLLREEVINPIQSKCYPLKHNSSEPIKIETEKRLFIRASLNSNLENRKGNSYEPVKM